MKQHINKVTSNCFFQIRRLKQVRRILDPEITISLITASVTSRLDYCNSVLAGLPKSTIAPLQRVQNAVARLITGIGRRDHVTPALQKLHSVHWLPIPYRITYKLCVLMHQVHTGRGPSYLSDLVTATADLSSRQALRSASSKRTKSHERNSSSGKEPSRSQDRLHGTLYPLFCKPNLTLRRSRNN